VKCGGRHARRREIDFPTALRNPDGLRRCDTQFFMAGRDAGRTARTCSSRCSDRAFFKEGAKRDAVRKGERDEDGDGDVRLPTLDARDVHVMDARRLGRLRLSHLVGETESAEFASQSSTLSFDRPNECLALVHLRAAMRVRRRARGRRHSLAVRETALELHNS
jgi:hypothetical protein